MNCIGRHVHNPMRMKFCCLKPPWKSCTRCAATWHAGAPRTSLSTASISCSEASPFHTGLSNIPKWRPRTAPLSARTLAAAVDNSNEPFQSDEKTFGAAARPRRSPAPLLTLGAHGHTPRSAIEASPSPIPWRPHACRPTRCKPADPPSASRNSFASSSLTVGGQNCTSCPLPPLSSKFITTCMVSK